MSVTNYGWQYPEERDFTKSFEKIAYRYGYNDVFRDFLDMSICALSFGRYEEKYHQVMDKYRNDEVRFEFPKLFALWLTSVARVYEDTGKPYDLLGEFYMKVVGGNEKTGQFFTPMPVCELMAQIAVGENSNQQYKSMCDPSCGSGRTLLAAHATSGWNLNYFFGADLDPTCCKMAILNFYAHGMVASEVAHMNSLSMEFYGGWRIQMDQQVGGPVIVHIDDFKEIGKWKYIVEKLGENANREDPEIRKKIDAMKKILQEVSPEEVPEEIERVEKQEKINKGISDGKIKIPRSRKDKILEQAGQLFMF